MSWLALFCAVAAVFVLVAWATSLWSVALSRVLDSSMLRRLTDGVLWRRRDRDRQRAALAEPGSPLRHASALFVPAVLAALAALAVLLPGLDAGCHCPAHISHHPHLCLIHPGFAAPLLVPALMVLGVWGLGALPGVLGLWRDGVATWRWGRSLRQLPVRRIAGVEVRVVDLGIASAFTVGVLSPFIVMDRRLVDGLDESQQRAIVLHEAAHRTRRDGLTLALLRLCRALWPVPGAAKAIERWLAAAEQQCDQHAASESDDPMGVAEALVAVERLRAAQSDADSVRLPVAALAAHAGDQLEARVRALLDDRSAVARRGQLGSDALALAIVALGVAALAITWPGDELHHFTEHTVEALTARLVD